MAREDLLTELHEVLERHGDALTHTDREAVARFVRLVTLDLPQASVGELVEAVTDHQAAAAVVSAAGAEAQAAWDASLAWFDDGARSAASWLQFHTTVSRGRAGSELKMGRGLRECPIVAA